MTFCIFFSVLIFILIKIILIKNHQEPLKILSNQYLSSNTKNIHCQVVNFIYGTRNILK